MSVPSPPIATGGNLDLVLDLDLDLDLDQLHGLHLEAEKILAGGTLSVCAAVMRTREAPLPSEAAPLGQEQEA